MPVAKRTARTGVWAPVVASAITVVACGSGIGAFDTTRDAPPTDAGAPGKFAPSSRTPDASWSTADGGGDSVLCATDRQEGKLAPLDLVLMQDTSGSMWGYVDQAHTTTKWTSIKSALASFMADPASAGLGIGVQFFPLFEHGDPNSCSSNAECSSTGLCFTKYCGTTGTLCQVQTDCTGDADSNPCTDLRRCAADSQYVCGSADDCAYYQLSPTTCDRPLQRGVCPNASVSCDVPDYAALAVPFGTLPGQAAAIHAALDERIPNSQTPTHAALQGAIAAARARKAARPNAVVAVVLSTDGVPYTQTNGVPKCTDDVGAITAVAAAARNGNPSVQTFVIGVLSPEGNTASARNTLDAIAISGGTDAASIIGVSPTTQADFIAALQKVRAQSLPCELALPVPKVGTPDYDKVNVVHTTPDADAPSTIRYVDKAAQCDAVTGGWHYDVDRETSTAKPTNVVLCPATCAMVQKDLGVVDIVQGCATNTDVSNVPK